MNKSEFIALIEYPENLGKEQVSALKEIAAGFPYFQAAQVLLAKALFNQNHYEFEKQLKHAALVVPDREVLYRFINHTQDKKEGEKVAVSVIPEVTLPVIETRTIPEEETILPTIEDEVIPVSIEEKVEEVEQVPEPIKDVLQVEEEVVLEEPMIPLPIAEEPAIVIEQTETPVVEDTLVEPAVPETFLVEESEKQETKETIEEHKNEVHSFSEWLRLTRSDNVSHTSHLEVEVQKEEKVEEVIKEEPVKTEIPQEPVENKSNIRELESLLDKFIKESPSISRPKAEFYNPQNMAKQSIEEDEDLVTETLANVYYKQGNYKKAIRAYEKLCLIYPHKMAYFADLIRKIKHEVKD